MLHFVRKYGVWLLLIIVLGLGLWAGQRYLNLASLQDVLGNLHALVDKHPVVTVGGFVLLYVIVTALSIPVATVLTLLGGALFGLWLGSLLVICGATLGATVAMLFSRYVLRDKVQHRFARQWRAVNQGIERDGAFYLFTLRMIPIFPFFIVNLLIGLSTLRTWTFMWISFVGMLPATMVYVNAGRTFATLDSLSGIVSPRMLFAFSLLGLLPLLSKKILNIYRRRSVLKGWQKPKQFDRHLIVIGAGAGGLVSAYIGAVLKAKVTLIEVGEMGGDCLNTGCVPSKTLLKSASVAQTLRQADKLGWRNATAEVDFAAVMDRVQQAITRIEPHDSVERYERLGVEVIKGRAALLDPWTVAVNGDKLTAKSIIIATGAKPRIPKIDGIEQVDYLTSETVWTIREQPQRLLVIGGGAVGCELAQAFQRLGSQVTLVQRDEHLLPQADHGTSALLAQALTDEGVDVRLGYHTVAFDDAQTLRCRDREGNEHTMAYDRVLLATGRQANVDGWGRETLGLALRDNATLQTDDFLATRMPHIYAVGDVTGPYQFTHAAAHQAWHAVVNALFGSFKSFRVSYRTLPWTVYTDPEIAQVGLTEVQAQVDGIKYEVTQYDLDDLDRAITDGATIGFIKVLTAKGNDRILGATIVGAHAGELINDYVTAIHNGKGLGSLLKTIRPYPSYGEANKYAAGEWKKAHLSPRTMQWLEKFQQWRLGK
ncbi:FAD-dependent oxidoreductase [Cardiobacteriaceae bacterium TAE3-ERU3]|nr:FAD-dependent oxidoreductase [Cardiobacteriaceae bacterium TAE3-ERU3]